MSSQIRSQKRARLDADDAEFSRTQEEHWDEEVFFFLKKKQ